jgi:transcriptional regulator with XRE-family HTH domain
MTDATKADWYGPDAATFGDRIAGAREAMGLKQSELAERIGVRRETLVGWEEDRTEPRANRLQMLAGLLGVSMRWLLTGEGDGIAEPGDETPAEARAILTDIRGLRVEAAQLADKIGRMEKRLRLAFAMPKEPAE